MTTELEKRIRELKLRSFTDECTNSILKEMLIELIILNNQIQAIFKGEN